MAIVTAMTLAERIVDLYTKHANDKIQKQDLEDLGATARQLSTRLRQGATSRIWSSF